MDPLACLNDARVCLEDGDYEECLYHLADYWLWRERGGFEPVQGDRLAVQYAKQAAEISA